MRFLIILIAYIIRRRLDSHRQWDIEPVLEALTTRVAGGRQSNHAALMTLILIAIGCLALLALDLTAIHSIWFAPWLLVELLLLLTTMGNPGWQDSLKAYGQAWQRHDLEGAWHHVRHLLPRNRQRMAVNAEKLHLILASRLLVTTFDGYFLMLFWFALLGPAGAVFIRLVMALRDYWPQPEGRNRAMQVYCWFAWAPMHLLSMTFALAGDFSGWVARRRSGDAVGANIGASTVESTLFAGANGALSSYSLEPERFASLHPDEWQDYGRRSLAAVRDLLNRSILVWIGTLALLAIAGVV